MYTKHKFRLPKLSTRSRALSVLLCVVASAVFAPCLAQSGAGQWQQPKEIQKPSGTWQQPGEIQKAGDIQKVVDKGGCRVTLIAASDALFEFDKSTLTPAASATLQQAQQAIAEQKTKRLRIRGHTDALGSDAYNQRLSRARAEAVRDWLGAHMSAPLPTTVEAVGKAEPVAPDKHDDGSDNPEGRARNRRVEIVLELCDAGAAK